MNLAVLTPSRGRPDRFAEMVEAIRATADGEVKVYLATDDDDVVYPHIDGVVTWRGPRKRLAGWTNTLAATALLEGADILAFLGDDHRPRTPGWDTRIRQAFHEMGDGLVYCADGLQNERLPTAPFWSASVIRALGWYYPPVLKHLYADDYWLKLARDLGRCTYRPDVLIEHCHPSAGKADVDDVYRENDTWYDHDRAAFEAFVRTDHPAVLRRVKEALGL